MAVNRQRAILRSDYPIVNTMAGKLRGFWVDDVFTFLGVKYADAKRFMPPKPVAGWDGVKDALDYGFICPTMNRGSRLGNFTVLHRYWPEDEDCQYLNVWTRSIEPDAKKPVMVWIHGGCYMDGSSMEMAVYEGDELARQNDVVSVTLNHRLNVLGFLDLSAYGEKYQYSGLSGMQDLVEALRWIHENIAAFGGDPDNVMLFGQSGGGSKVSTLLQIPAADGLYQKVAIQSGVPNAGPNVTKKETLLFAETLVEGLGLTAETIGKIEELPYACICEKAKELFGFDLMWKLAPSPDGEYYKGLFLDVGFRPETKNIPVLVGCNMGEFNRATTDDEHDRWSEERKRSKIAERFHEDTDKVIDIFKKTYPGKDILFLLDTDSKVRPRTLTFASMRASQADAKVYNYMFTYIFPFLGGRTAWHCAEIPYAFRNPLTEYADVTGGPDDSLALDAAIGGAWAAFAKTGYPGCDALPNWPAFSADNPTAMIFDIHSHPEAGHDKELLEMMLKHPLPSDMMGMKD